MIVVNGELTNYYDIFSATVIIHIIGLLATSCICAVKKVHIFSGIRKRLPLLMYCVGAVGVATTMFNNIAYNRISVSSIVALGLVGQSAASLIIDQFGFFNMPIKRFNLSKLIGLLFTVAGVAYLLIGAEFALIPVILSVLTGVSIVVSRSINAQLAAKTDVLSSTWYNYAAGLIVSALILVVASNVGDVPFRMAVSLKSWIYLGGVIGVCVVALSNVVTPKMPAFHLSLILFAGQMFTGVVLDSIISQKFAASSLIGGLFVTIGLALNAWLDSKSVKRKLACRRL